MAKLKKNVTLVTGEGTDIYNIQLFQHKRKAPHLKLFVYPNLCHDHFSNNGLQFDFYRHLDFSPPLFCSSLITRFFYKKPGEGPPGSKSFLI